MVMPALASLQMPDLCVLQKARLKLLLKLPLTSSNTWPFWVVFALFMLLLPCSEVQRAPGNLLHYSTSWIDKEKFGTGLEPAQAVLSSLKLDYALGPLLVKNPVATVAAADDVVRLELHLVSAVSTDV